MSAPATVKIPIKPHLKKYVLFTMDCQEPIATDEKGMIGRCIINVLKEKREHRFDNVLEKYTDRIEVQLNADMRSRSPKLHRLLYINIELERLFREAIIIWVHAQKDAGMPANEACKNFLAKLKIEEREYSFDAAYKLWQRFNDIRKARKRNTANHARVSL
jgi:hypothetical protein